MKKIIILILLLIIGVTAGLIIINRIAENGERDFEPPAVIDGEEDAQLPNPASVYCEEQGGELEIRTLADGSQKGFCLFDNGSECEEWKFFNSECKKGDAFCKDLCGDGICQEIVCLAVGCPCAETKESCPEDCGTKTESENIQLEIKDFTTDKKTYASNEELKASLTVLSSGEVKGALVKLTGIKPSNYAYINSSQTVNLIPGKNEIIFTETTPYCTSGCGGVYPGPYNLNIEVFIEENLSAGSAALINLTDNFVEDGDSEKNISGQEEIVDLDGDGMVRTLDKELILEKIKQGRNFLFQMADEEKKGFHKYYYAETDDFEDRLHTVYSASIIYTFLYINDLEEDEEILENLEDWGDFLLSMQNQDEKGKAYGAFHYSYYLDNKEKEDRFVVGTAALSIFTLLRLYDITGDSRYLTAAESAGDWLLTMQKDNGSMKSYIRAENGSWFYGTKESLLYNGQVLSALSKLYQTTEEEKYYDSAEKIAQYFAQKYEKTQGFITGEYREENPISNSWVIMSLMDFYRANPDDYYKEIIFSLAEKVVGEQKNDSSDLLHYGSWWKVYSTSGVGWISEVMTETYRFCQEQDRENCQIYKDSALKAMRLLVQNTFSEENSSGLKNPARAIGGVFWNADKKYVRTDSVCHALNGYLRIMDYLEEGPLISLPE